MITDTQALEHFANASWKFRSFEELDEGRRAVVTKNALQKQLEEQNSTVPVKLLGTLATGCAALLSPYALVATAFFVITACKEHFSRVRAHNLIQAHYDAKMRIYFIYDILSNIRHLSVELAFATPSQLKTLIKVNTAAIHAIKKPICELSPYCPQALINEFEQEYSFLIKTLSPLQKAKGRKLEEAKKAARIALKRITEIGHESGIFGKLVTSIESWMVLNSIRPLSKDRQDSARKPQRSIRDGL